MHRRLALLFYLTLIFCVPLVAQDSIETTQAPADLPSAVIDGGGRVENPPEELNLAYKFKPGQINRYQVRMTNKGSFRLLQQDKDVDLNTVTEMIFIQQVKSEEDGLYKVEWLMQAGEVRIPDFGNSVISIPDITYTMDERGNVKKMSGLAHLAILPGKPQQKTMATLLGELRFQGFPDKALKVGDEWSHENQVESPEGYKFTIKTISKLVGYEKYDKYDCANIETKYDYPVKLVVDDKTFGKLRLEGKESGKILTRFAFKEGKMIRSEGDIKSEAKVFKSDGAPGDAFVKLEINAISELLPPSVLYKKEIK